MKVWSFLGSLAAESARASYDARTEDSNGRGVPSGAQKHVVERFSLSEDGTRAIVDVTIEDPEFLVESFSGRTEMVYVPHLQLYRYGCTPE